MHQIKRLVKRFRSSIWLYPTVVAIFSMLAAFIIFDFDKYVVSDVYKVIPGILLSRVELARSVHSIIASAFITIMTFTFSTTMVVLTMYMSQLSPRVVENFLTHRNTMRSFSVFVGGFIFAIVSLLLANNISDGVRVISATLSAGYLIVGVMFFLLFVNNVAMFIQTSNVIERLYNEAKVNIRDYVSIIRDYDIHPHNDFTKMPMMMRIPAKKSTYIQNVDYTKLRALAESYRGTIVFNKAVGQFVYKDEVLATIHGDDSSAVPDDIESRVRACYIVGDQRTENQDYNYSIQKIIEVALRAISPGINDPNTAIHCIRMISVVLEDLIRFESGYVFMDEGDDQTGLIFEVFNLESLMNTTYNQIVHYGSADASVMMALIKSINANVIKATTHNQIGMLNYAEYVWQQIQKNIQNPYEIKLLKSAMDELRSNVNA